MRKVELLFSDKVSYDKLIDIVEYGKARGAFTFLIDPDARQEGNVEAQHSGGGNVKPDSQQLQAKIRAIVIETVEAQNGSVDAGELLCDLVADLRVLSAM
jgi:hypothetical protein